MKMRKLLAASVAASVAASSMAAIASAEEKTFSFLTNYGVIKGELNDGDAIDLGDKFSMTDDEFTGSNGATQKSFGLVEKVGKTLCADGYIAVNIAKLPSDAKVKLAVTGVKGTRTAGSKTYTYDFKTWDNGAFWEEADWNGKIETSKDTGFLGASAPTDAKYVYLPLYATDAPEGGFLPEQFLEITKFDFVIEATDSFITYDEKEYNTYGDSVWGWNDGDAFTAANGWWDGKANDGKGAMVDAAYVVAEFEGDEGKALIETIRNNLNGGYYYGFTEKELKEEYAFLPRTTSVEGEDIERNEVRVLSDTDAYTSVTADELFWTIDNDYATGDGQSYDDDNLGTIPNRFGGLASQMADFFNKQTNGTVTFKFTPPVNNNNGGTWASGGVPSTEVGIKNMLSSAQENDFALFVNYEATTGSLQAATEIDAASGTVVFDISEILDDMGGLTKATLEDVYYGLNKGIDTYKCPVTGETAKGMYVESVTLAYDADADVEADIEDEDDAEDDATVEEDDDVVEEDDATIEEDDATEDDAEEDDATEDDAEVNGDVIDTPVVEDDDANPGTGVALAVVPAMVAAAAVVLSKKRK